MSPYRLFNEFSGMRAGLPVLGQDHLQVLYVFMLDMLQRSINHGRNFGKPNFGREETFDSHFIGRIQNDCRTP